MGCDIHGWVVINRWKSSEYLWPVVDIGSITDRDYRTFSELFGVRTIKCQKGLYAERGILDQFKDYRSSEEKCALELDLRAWGNDAHSHSWVTFNEFKDWYMQRVDSLSESWKTLFSIMQILALEFGKECVKMQVWFDN